MKRKYNEDKIWIFLASFVFILFIVVILLGYSFFRISIVHNNNVVKKTISELTYTEDNVYSELSTVQKLNELSFISLDSKGLIFKALTELSYMLGDDMLYNKYFANAWYYLQKTGHKEDYIYLVNNYVGRLYANGCYKSAKTILNQLTEFCKLDDFSTENQVSYYLTYADVEQMIGEYSLQYIQRARDVIDSLPETNEKKLKQAKLDILNSRYLIINNDFEDAERIISKYSENDNFGLGSYQVYVVCDFKIPYYEIMTKLEIHNKDFDTADYYANLYITNCDNYEFRAMKLRLLQYIVNATQENHQIYFNKYSEMEKNISSENLAIMTEEYGSFLLSNISSIIEELTIQQEDNNRLNVNIFICALICYLLFLSFCIFRIFINHITKDSLTQLNNRKKYENIRSYCEKKHISHSFLMIDIDDFKKVNDTFGHTAGDEVLKSVSNIILKYVNRDISAYRYGGEELCLFLLNISENQARKIAEEIRKSVEDPKNNTVCPISVSIGIGFSTNGENVFQQADKNLYFAKNHGKNQVV